MANDGRKDLLETFVRKYTICGLSMCGTDTIFTNFVVAKVMHLVPVKICMVIMEGKYAVIKNGIHVSHNIKVEKSVKQGDGISPVLFILALNLKIQFPNKRNSFYKNSAGVKVWG